MEGVVGMGLILSFVASDDRICCHLKTTDFAIFLVILIPRSVDLVFWDRVLFKLRRLHIDCLQLH